MLPFQQEGRTGVMGILNVTPDSFSDGGLYPGGDEGLAKLVSTAGAMLAHGADILDIGGESTRPGAREIPVAAELSRVIPSIQAIHTAYPDAFISIDTRKAAVAQAAVEAGARMINDVSGLRFDPKMAQVAAKTGVYLVIMHSIGTPETMQENPSYIDVVKEVGDFLARQTEVAMAAGVSPEKIWLDPGFGFGKTVAQNLELLARLGEFKAPASPLKNFPLLVGTSRKSFLTLGKSKAGSLDAGSPKPGSPVENSLSIPPTDREALTAASLALAVQNGANAVRVHDVAVQAPVVRLLAKAAH